MLENLFSFSILSAVDLFLHIECPRVKRKMRLAEPRDMGNVCQPTGITLFLKYILNKIGLPHHTRNRETSIGVVQV